VIFGGLRLSTDDGGTGGDHPRAYFYVPNCRTLRVSAGKTKSDLARAADVDRNTVNKIEHLVGVTEETAHGVFNALKNWHPSKKLDAKVEITKTPRKIRLTGHSSP
jgi:hypothetical protein